MSSIGSAPPPPSPDASLQAQAAAEGANDSFAEAVSRHAVEMRAHSRYPLTYAYDWIKGAICTQLSRSEASHRITVACERLGISKGAVVLEMAEQYIAHYAVMRANDETADQQRRAWAFRLAAPPIEGTVTDPAEAAASQLATGGPESRNTAQPAACIPEKQATDCHRSATAGPMSASGDAEGERDAG